MLYTPSTFSARSPSPGLRASSATPDSAVGRRGDPVAPPRSVQDRTAEFFATVEGIVDRMEQGGTLGPQERRRLLGSPARANSPNGALVGPGKSALAGQVAARTQFAREAAAIGKDINQTMDKLGKLAKLAKRKTLFDDRPEEINQLMFVIKQDIGRINARIASLQTSFKQPPQPGSPQFSGKQAEDHARNVVVSLQGKLAETSSTFKDILEMRTQNLKDQKQRRDQYGFAPLPANGPSLAPATDSPLYHANGPSSSTLPPPPSEHVIDFGGGFQSQELVQAGASQDYISSRAQAIESIESTIAELGQIYSNFMTVLAGQRETVQRIDEHIQDVELNVEGAHNQLLKYYQGLQSNRWLVIKVLFTLIFFFMVFVMML
ncbi:t-SNARE [Hyaloraphidium curvatum]|nr:t-SNARE [Hyaloraphidium curvatum]